MVLGENFEKKKHEQKYLKKIKMPLELVQMKKIKIGLKFAQMTHWADIS